MMIQAILMKRFILSRSYGSKVCTRDCVMQNVTYETDVLTSNVG